MRLFECGTLVPGCDWHTRANDDAEVVRRAVEHMKTAHGETTIRENMVDNIKARIRNEANAARSFREIVEPGEQRRPVGNEILIDPLLFERL